MAIGRAVGTERADGRAAHPGGRGGATAQNGGAKPGASEAEQAFAAQMVRGLSAAVQQRGGIVTLRVQPEALGQVRIRLGMQGDRVSARFEVATPEARDLLAGSSESLRSSLEARGLNVERLNVHLTTEEHPSGLGHHEREGTAGTADDGQPGERGGQNRGDERGGQGRGRDGEQNGEDVERHVLAGQRGWTPGGVALIDAVA